MKLCTTSLLNVLLLFYFQYGNLKWQNGSISPVETASGDETYQLNFQPSTISIKPEKGMKSTEMKGLQICWLLTVYNLYDNFSLEGWPC